MAVIGPFLRSEHDLRVCEEVAYPYQFMDSVGDQRPLGQIRQQDRVDLNIVLLFHAITLVAKIRHDR